ncbi:hypothetical protein [Vreelandella neptunia]|uniref:Uncharacterized protein n=1 Tax=Vreelandella neptunia TaxID=115551 RepID=A0ABS9SD35_9GAMM|nr:hypothetical protein [Halomonas neptunia]MCH4814036.1 hypothetical protein [Halomonas neptunia]
MLSFFRKFIIWFIRKLLVIVDVFEESIISNERFDDELKREGVKKKFRRFVAYLFVVSFIWQLSRFIPVDDVFSTTREAVSGFLFGNIIGLFLYIARDRNEYLSWKEFESQDKVLLVGMAVFVFFMPGMLLSGHLGVAAAAGGVTAYTVTLPFFYESWRGARLDEINHVRIKKEVYEQVCSKMCDICLSYEREKKILF